MFLDRDGSRGELEGLAAAKVASVQPTTGLFARLIGVTLCQPCEVRYSSATCHSLSFHNAAEGKLGKLGMGTPGWGVAESRGLTLKLGPGKA